MIKLVPPRPENGLWDTGEDIFVVKDGVLIAKRGRPGTPQAGTWVSLEPGWSVTDIDGGISIEHKKEASAIDASKCPW
jgi:hypothetical protein